MTVRVRHIDFPLPGVWQLARALAARRLSVLEIYLLVASCAVLLVLRQWWAALLVPVSAITVELVASDRSTRLIRHWRMVRRRRRMLNAPAGRDARRAALYEEIAGMAARARREWHIHMADAVVGRTHSVIHDRPAPRIQALQRLEAVPRCAAALNIALADDDAGLPDAGEASLHVPPAESFAPDTLSPTMMNVTAESLAHARAEGARRATRRHEAAVEQAALFEPMIRFADRAVAALRDPDGAYQR